MFKVTVFLCLLLICYTCALKRSSHSEAPGTAQIPSADLTDYYVFSSYEPGRSNFVTFLLNAYPLQSPFGGPNYFTLSDSHFYEMYIDSNTDGTEDVTFQWLFGSGLPVTTPLGKPLIYFDDFACKPLYSQSLAAPIAPEVPIPTGLALNVSGNAVKIALKVAGNVANTQPETIAQIGPPSENNLNWVEYYSVNVLKGDLSTMPTPIPVSDIYGRTTFRKPFDYAGEFSFGPASDYENYAMGPKFMNNISLASLQLPGCPSGQGRMWVGQRSEPFWISLGRIFDYLNLIPVALPQFAGLTINNSCPFQTNNDLREKNVATIALEIPNACFSLNQGVLYTWAGVRNLIHNDGDNVQGVNGTHVAGAQVSRLGNPLVNELVIGLIEKDRFSRQHPRLDADATLGFGTYVLYPTLPEIITKRYLAAVNSVLGLNLATLSPPTPRNDLLTVFLTGIPGVNQGAGSTFVGEVIRLNTSIPPVPRGSQNNYGLAGTLVFGGPNPSDFAGYPNGRRPGDDVTDISLMAVMGVLCTEKLNLCNNNNITAPIGLVPLIDGTDVRDTDFYDYFPYFTTPTPGSYAYGPTADPTVCYPPSQLGRCPISAVAASTTTTAAMSGSRAASMSGSRAAASASRAASRSSVGKPSRSKVPPFYKKTF